MCVMEVGCRDHGHVVAQFRDRGLMVALGAAAHQSGFRPTPKEEFVEALPELWKLASAHPRLLAADAEHTLTQGCSAPSHTQVQECWQYDPHDRPTFVAIVHQLKRMDPVLLNIQSTSTVSGSASTTLFSDEESAAATSWFAGTSKEFVAFLSHHKEACATEARLVKGELDPLFGGAEAFLDSDNLQASTHIC